MTTTTTTASAAPTSAPIRLGARARTGQIVLTVLFVLCGMIALSTAFAPDPFEREAVVLIASFGVLAAALGVAAVWGAIRSRTIQVAVWALPLFLISHVAALGTWVPDAVLALVAGIGCALVVGAGRRGA